MVYYIASPNNLMLLKELCETNEMDFEYTTNIKDIKAFTNMELKKLTHIKCFVIDIDCLTNTELEIVEAISGMPYFAPNAKIIVVALGRNADDKLITALVARNVCNIILSKDKEIAKKEFEQCLSNKGREKTDVVPENTSAFAEEKKSSIAPSDKQSIPTNIKKDMPVLGNSMVTIGVCGVEPHVGATHHALALTKFLVNQGFKACYLEENIHGDIDKLLEIYEDSGRNVREDSSIDWYGLKIYHNYSFLDILSLGYQFYVYDYGTCRDITAKEFVSNDIKLLISGSKPWEFFNYNKVLENISSVPGLYSIMNFCIPNMQNDLCWDELKDTTFFAQYSPDVFDGTENYGIYKKIMSGYIGDKGINSAPSGMGKIKKRFGGWMKK